MHTKSERYTPAFYLHLDMEGPTPEQTDNSIFEIDARSFHAESYLSYLRLLPLEYLDLLLGGLILEENYERAALVKQVIEEISSSQPIPKYYPEGGIVNSPIAVIGENGPEINLIP